MGFWSPKSVVRKARRARPRRLDTKHMDLIAEVGEEKATEMHRTLLKGIRTFQKEITPGRLGKVWGSGDYNKVVDALPWEKLPQHFKNSFNGLVATKDAAGRLAVEALPRQAKKELRFDESNPRIARYITERSGSLIVEATRDTKRQVKSMVRNALNRGDTPKDIANQVRGVVGLTTRQAASVLAHRRGLQAQNLPPDVVQERSSAFEDRTLDRRALMIGVTESRFAVNLGQQEVWDEAVDQDLLPSSTQKMWIVEENPCDVCADIDGTSV